VTIEETQNKALEANTPELWNQLWGTEGTDTWRKDALKTIYERIVHLVPEGTAVSDWGGGVGILACMLEEKKCGVVVWDHSETALDIANSYGLVTYKIDFEKELNGFSPWHADQFIVSTETIEHLTEPTRNRLLADAATRENAIFSVPNDRLGPDVEPQHTIQYTAKSFKTELEQYFEHVRVEVYGAYLLGVCGELAKKPYTLSVTMPVRDEAADLEKTLASFRGIADEMIIGVDPRTIDNTKEIAEKYADLVFDIESPQGPEDDYQGDEGVHFSWCRNQCIDKCTSEWVFMTEGHEHLQEGTDILLRLHQVIPSEASVAMVVRRGQGQRWCFPWLFRNLPEIRFTRSVHNTLEFPEKMYYVSLPSVITYHDRVHDRTKERVVQRRSQNRKSLFKDWLMRESQHSLFYLAQEWRGYDDSRSENRFLQLLATGNNGAQRYQARLILACMYRNQGRIQDAYDILINATADDWSRSEHWLWLGDIAFQEKHLENAYVYYRYAATMIGAYPFTLWWIDENHYSYLPAQRLAMICGELGKFDEGLQWAKRVVDLIPIEAHDEMISEAQEIIKLFEEATSGSSQTEN